MDKEISCEGENVDELRQRLNAMKKMMAERQYRDESMDSKQRSSSVIDGNFLSMVFGTALVVIVTVSAYAFYNLYIAILKKFPSEHDEL